MKSKNDNTPAVASETRSLGHRFIYQHGRPKNYGLRVKIYSAGESADEIYLISSGEVKISRPTDEGREMILEYVGPGNLFGESEILLGTKRESHATARTPLHVHALSREILMGKAEQDAQFSLWLTGQMSRRQERMEERLESLLFKSATGKVAQLLCDLVRSHGRSTQEGTVIEYPMTHQEIGDFIATTRETVSYTFMEFRELGLIATQKRKTIVRNMPGLEALAMS
jgi:CRP-like cAMP-binding protein